QLVRQLLEGMDLEVFPVTSGSKGVHVYAPLDGSATSQEISDVAHELARSLESDHRDLIVSAMKNTLRENSVFIDWSQNSATKTNIAPLPLRGPLTQTVTAHRSCDDSDNPAPVFQHRVEVVLDRNDDDGDQHDYLTQATGGSVEAPQ